MKPPVVFISYSHDSQEHKDRILDLSDQLREEGVDCTIDQYEESPPEGWPKWMIRQVRKSDFVIVICTEVYYRRVVDEEEPGKGKGAKWESTLTYQDIYDADAKNTKFIPVLLDPNDAKHIPEILKGVTYYCVDTEDGYKKLYRRLTNQPEITKPKLGKPQKLPARERKRGPVAVEVSLAKLPPTSPDLFGREKQLKMLDEAWEDENTCVVSLVAFGGVGKTALVNVWLNEMQRDNYRGAERVYGWSFYSQGAREGAQASADEFIDAALGWFGDPDPTQGSPWDKGERLAGLVKRQRTLLILDGLEPLQYPPGEMAGRLKEPGLQCLLRELARQNPGLCIVTTRLEVDDLSEHVGASVKRENLEDLSPQAGVQLLRKLGADGTDDELKQAVDEFDGHALALTLLGTYLHIVHKGDIRQRDKIPKLIRDKHQDRHIRHARRVMESYEKWFKGEPELDILHIMGLFDRPAEGGAIDAVRADPVIEGLTSELVKLSHDDWQFALSNLREARLLAPEDTDSLDCHPLIREHFGEKLREGTPDVWKAAHSKLYEYYKSQPRKYLPDTIEEMAPLFAAVVHGCQTGRHQEVFDEIYWPRISREHEYFNTMKLGAFGTDLAALSDILGYSRRRIVIDFPRDKIPPILGQLGFDLRALGRPKDATVPMYESLKTAVEHEDWGSAVTSSANLSELHLIMGEVPRALDFARQSITLADKHGGSFWRLHGYIRMADALHQSGHLKCAMTLFSEAEAIHTKREPDFPILYSIQGYLYCDLLLSQGKYSQTQKRAARMLKWAKEDRGSSISIGLSELSLGSCQMLEVYEGERSRETAEYLEDSVAELRNAARQDHLPRGLLTRSELHRMRGDLKHAQQDLDEAMTIATRGGMRLHEADCHLEYARLYLAMSDKHKARESLDTAKKMIEEMGYHRRDPEVLLATAHLYILEGRNDDARQTLDAARTLIDEMGCHRWDIEFEVLEEQLKV